MNDNILSERADRVENAFRLLQNNKDSLGNIPGILRQLVSMRVWEGYSWKGKTITFGTFREFVEASPPEGLGASVEDLVTFCKKYPEIAELIDQTVQEQMPEYRSANKLPTHNRSNGTSYQRSLRRLRTLAQENDKAKKLREQVLNGEITANAALKDLGIKKARYGVEATIDGIVQFAKKHLSKSQIKKAAKILEELS
jgi:hypothetical protein